MSVCLACLHPSSREAVGENLEVKVLPHAPVSGFAHSSYAMCIRNVVGIISVSNWNRGPANAGQQCIAEPQHDQSRSLSASSGDDQVFIALGTEGGRLACWALDDTLNALASRNGQLKVEPVPDALCPSLCSSFNPYNQTVQVREFFDRSGELQATITAEV